MKKYTATEHFLYGRDISVKDDGILLFKGTAENDIEKLHTHEFIEITYIFSGEGIHKINGVSYPVKRGDLLFINYTNTHYFKPTDKFTYCNINLLPSFVSSELINSENAMDLLMLSTFNTLYSDIKALRPLIHFQKNEADEVEVLIEDMLREFNNREKDYKTAIKSLLTILLIKIFRKMQSEDNIGGIEKTGRLTPEIIEYIENNCFEKISLKDLAERSFYNPSYFSRMFKNCYGITLSTFIQKQRIKKAQELLIESDISVNKICTYVGYNDKTLFYKNFKKYSNNMLPNEYRKKYASTALTDKNTE